MKHVLSLIPPLGVEGKEVKGAGFSIFSWLVLIVTFVFFNVVTEGAIVTFRSIFYQRICIWQ